MYGVILLLCFTLSVLSAQVTLSTDFTNQTDQKAPIHEIWDVANRISPTNGSNVRTGTDINLVRMMGGIVKKVDGVKVPDLDYDPCLYDSVNNVYVYRWDPLIERLGKIVNGQTDLHQLVLDQPSWAFQHGYEFIPEGQMDGVHFREDERVSIYGNSLPPKDKVAYFDFIKAMMEKLIEEFGEEEVSSWRFRVGSEIETPDHWFGTKQDFIEHFANTEKAVRSVLPNAKIGLHTRTPGFLYKNGTPKNYKGEPFASFADGLIEYCHDNDVQYDFWGISDYVLINGEKYRDVSTKYDSYYKDLQEHPKWNQNATLDMMEYSTVITMTPPDGGVYLNCETSHKDIIELGLSHMFYRKGIDRIFRWGQRTGSADYGPIADLRDMIGNVRYETTTSGSPQTSTNQLDAIFTQHASGDAYDVMVYNFNVKSLNYVTSEAVKLSFATDLPVGTKLFYRNNAYGRDQNKLQQFLLKEGTGDVLSGWDEKGDPSRTLTDAGQTKYDVFTDYKPIVFNGWKSVVTVARTDNQAGSVVVVDATLPSFAYQKFEFRPESQLVTPIASDKVQWTTSEDFASWTALSNGMTVNTDNDKLSLTFADGFGFPMAGVDGLNMQADLYDKMRVVLRNTTPEANVQIAVNAPGTSFVSGRLRPSVANDGTTQVLEVDLAAWGLWTGTIADLKFYNKVNSGTIEIDTIEFISSAQQLEVTVEQEGQGILNYSSGICLAGQTFNFTALAEPGWVFHKWQGDVNSTANPLNVKVDSAMTIKAVFALERHVSVTTEGNGSVNLASGIYADGEALQFVATPDAGWVFSGWTGDAVSSEDTLQVTLDADFSVQATFTEITYDVNLSHVGNGALSHTTDTHSQGAQLVLTATADAGWEFSGWSGATTSTDNPLTISVDSAMTIVATFTEVVSSVDAPTATVVRASPNPSANGVFCLTTLPTQTWDVYSMSGQKVLTGTGSQVDLSSSPRGVYMLKVDQSIIKLLYQ